MSHGRVEKSETSVVGFVAFLFFGLLILCGLEFGDNMAKDAEGGGSSKPHH